MQRRALSSTLSPIQRDVLWILEEAGEENLPTVLNTLRSNSAGVPDEVLIPALSDALRGLWRSDLITFCRYRGGSDARSEDLSPGETQSVLAVSEVVRWNEDGGYWQWDEARGGGGRVSVVVPDEVLHALRHGEGG